MEQAAPVEYSRARYPKRWIGPAAVLLALGAVLAGSPDILGWAPGAFLGAPLALFAGLALFLLPGLALLRLLRPSLPITERLAYAAGLSVTFPPLLFLYSEPFGLRWGPAACWTFLAVCALTAFWPRRAQAIKTEHVKTSANYTGILLLLITLLALLVRLFVVREQVAGAFGDSYHHTMIVELMAQNGGLFQSWQPFAPLVTFTYHYGFHSAAVWLYWLSGYPPTLSVIAIGQIESALAAPLLYLFTTRLFGSRRAGLWAAIVMGFLAVFPSYYVNWGRYTQLAGQTALLVACVAWMDLLSLAADSRVSRRELARPILLAIATTTGVALNHYRISVFAICFVLLYFLFVTATQVRRPAIFGRLLAGSLIVGLAAGLITLPWLLRLRNSALLRLAGVFLSSDSGLGQGVALPPADLARAMSYGLLPLAGLGLLLALLRRRWVALLLPAWAIIVWLAANPQLLGLKGAGMIASFTVVIAAYLVLAPLAGYCLGATFEWIEAIGQRRSPAAQSSSRFDEKERFFTRGILSRSPNGDEKGPQRRSMLRSYKRHPLVLSFFTVGLQLLLATAIVAWGLGAQQRLVDPSYELFTPADLAAMAWIREHTPADAKFFVNSFPAYGNTAYAGSDGGWWIPLMTGRYNNLEPMTYGVEATDPPDYYREIFARNHDVLIHRIGSAEATAALKSRGYDYLYDGPAANPSGEPITPTSLAGSPFYEQVYSRDGVTIWKVR